MTFYSTFLRERHIKDIEIWVYFENALTYLTLHFQYFHFFDKYADFNKYYLKKCVSSSVLKNL